MTEKVRKITKVQRFEDIKALLIGDVVTYDTDVTAALEFIDHEIELLMRKNTTGDKKPTKLQVENAGYKELIKTFLLNQSESVTVTQVMKGIPEFADFSNQKVARLMRDMLEAGIVTKKVDKGKSLFSLR